MLREEEEEEIGADSIPFQNLHDDDEYEEEEEEDKSSLPPTSLLKNEQNVLREEEEEEEEKAALVVTVVSAVKEDRIRPKSIRDDAKVLLPILLDIFFLNR